MRSFLFHFVAVAMFAVPAFAQSVDERDQIQSDSSEPAYVLNRTEIAHPAGLSELELPEDTVITVLEMKSDSRGIEFVRLGVDSDDSSLPSEIWVKESELKTFSMDLLGDGEDYGLDDLLGLGDADFWKRHRSSGTHGGRQGKHPGKRPSKHPSKRPSKKMTYCYRFVKLYLLSHGLVDRYLPGGSAWNAKNILPTFGFHRTGHRPQQAKLNEVCVYFGGKGGNGHIEVRTSRGWYYGYGYKSTPISVRNHRLIGCYAK